MSFEAGMFVRCFMLGGAFGLLVGQEIPGTAGVIAIVLVGMTWVVRALAEEP